MILSAVEANSLEAIVDSKFSWGKPYQALSRATASYIGPRLPPGFYSPKIRYSLYYA